MPQKSIFLIVFFLLFICSAQAQTNPKKSFGSRALLGVHFGTARDWESERDNRFETTNFWGARAGISITERLYAGIQARSMQARNFETPWQSFYMAGLWGRGYLIHPALPGKPNRLGVFLETGFLIGNYSFDNKNFIEYYVRRSGRWYIPIMLGAELRLIKNLTAEAGLQLYYNNGQNWDQYGFGYASIGLNYHLGKE